MKILYFLGLSVRAFFPESGVGFGQPRFNQSCDSMENAEICENNCHFLYQDCIWNCDDNEVGLENLHLKRSFETQRNNIRFKIDFEI